MVSRAGPPPMINVSIDSSAMALRFPRLARSRSGRGAHDPAPECCEIALLALKTAIDQIPAHALWHGERERRDQPSCRKVIVDIGADAHGDAETVGSRLQRLAVILKFGAARGHATCSS